MTTVPQNLCKTIEKWHNVSICVLIYIYISINGLQFSIGAKIANVTGRGFPNDAVVRMRFGRDSLHDGRFPSIGGGVASQYKRIK